MSRTEFFSLASKQDGLPLSVMQVAPEGEIRSLVQLAHGMSEHKERYLPFMQYLAERGCLCVLHDHRGHGASVRRREDLGYFYSDGDIALVEDMHQITLWMKQKYPGKKLFLFGHSMGSLAVRAYCEEYDHEIDSLAVCGSPGYNFAAPFAQALVRLLILLKGDRHRSRIMQAATIGMFARKFPDADHPSAWISAHLENVIAYEQDPLCSFIFTLNGNLALLNLMRRAYSLKDVRKDLPVRFYSGAEDACMMGKKGFDHAMKCMRRAGCRDVQGHLFPGMRHEILNEAEKQAVFECIWQESFQPYL